MRTPSVRPRLVTATANCWLLTGLIWAACGALGTWHARKLYHLIGLHESTLWLAAEVGVLSASAVFFLLIGLGVSAGWARGLLPWAAVTLVLAGIAFAVEVAQVRTSARDVPRSSDRYDEIVEAFVAISTLLMGPVALGCAFAVGGHGEYVRWRAKLSDPGTASSRS